VAIEAARLQVTVSANTSEAEKGVDSFGKRLGSMSKDMAIKGSALSLGITAPLLGIAKAGLDSAMSFEQNMNVMQQVVGATSSEMATMQDMALQLGADTVFSASEAAEAMLELGKAGMDTSDVMESIGGVMDLAAAGGVGLAEAANLTASTLNAFGLEATESTRIANIMAATANASAADISDLGMGMQQAGFAFSMANQPVENLAASLAILTNVGLTGSDAGTALKNAFMRMMNPTKEAASLMADLGISFYDANGNMKMLPDIIDNLNSAMSGLSSEQRDAALATIFLSDGMKAMIPLMNEGKQGFTDTVTEVTAAGAATENAAARMGGLGGAIEQLKGSVDSFLIGAAMPFMGTLSGIVGGVANAVSWLGQLPQPIINAGLAFAGVLAVAGPLMAAIGGLSLAFGAIGGTTLLVIAAVGALAAAWAADLGGIQSITAQAMGEVQKWFASTVTAAQELGRGIQAAFTNTKFPNLETLWSQFKAGEFEQVANTIRDTAYELMVNLDAELNITATANQLKQRLVEVVNSLSTAITSLDFGAVGTKFNSLRDGILNGLTSAVSSIPTAQIGRSFAGIVEALRLGVSTLDFSSIDWVGVLQTAFLGPAMLAFQGIKWVVGSEAFQGLVQAVQSALSSMPWGDMGSALAGLGKAIGSQIGTVLGDMVTDVTAAINGVDFAGASQRLADGISSIAVSISQTDWTQIGSEAAQGIKSIASGFKGLFSGDRSIAAAFDEAVRAAFMEVNWGQLQVAMQGLSAAVDKAFLDFAAGISAEFDLKPPQWVTSLQNFLASPPAWIVDLTTWDTSPAWLEQLMSWNPQPPGWLTSLINWKPQQPQWIQSLSDWSRSAISAIQAFSWDEWISETLDWPTAISEFSWETWLDPLLWPLGTIQGFSWWTWITSLVIWPHTAIGGFDWWTWVTSSVAWPQSIIDSFDWGTWVSKLTWPLSKILDFDWGRFISTITIPIPGLGGGTTSPSVDSPGVDSGGSIPKLAPLRRSGILGGDMALAGAGNSGVVVNIANVTVANDMDVHDLAYKLGRQIQAGMR
jgi:TP901 family phage tail tape measure protein